MNQPGNAQPQASVTEESSINTQALLFAAMSRAQGEFKELAKNRTVTITPKNGGRPYSFRYADLEACIAATRPALAKNGLAVLQIVGDGKLITILTHEDGGMLDSAVSLPGSNGDPKNFGALITYYRRYTYCALLGIAADDDLDEDGIEAGDVANDNQPEPQRKPQATPRSQATPGKVNDAMIRAIRSSLESSGKSESELCAQFGVATIEDLPRPAANQALEWIKS